MICRLRFYLLTMLSIMAWPVIFMRDSRCISVKDNTICYINYYDIDTFRPDVHLTKYIGCVLSVRWKRNWLPSIVNALNKVTSPGRYGLSNHRQHDCLLTNSCMMSQKEIISNPNQKSERSVMLEQFPSHDIDMYILLVVDIQNMQLLAIRLQLPKGFPSVAIFM